MRNYRLLLFALIALLAPQLGVIVIQAPPYANILAGQHFNTTNVSGCTVDEDTTSPNVLPNSVVAECNATTAPGLEGDEFLAMMAVADAENKHISFDLAFPAAASGTLVFESLFRVDDDAEVNNNTFFRASDDTEPAASAIYPYMSLYYLSNTFRIYCGSDANDFSTATYTEDVTYPLKLEWHIDDGPGNCTIGCQVDGNHCGCMWLDNVEIAGCDSANDPGLHRGWRYIVNLGKYDLWADRMYACNQLPPSGTFCGESDTFP